MPIYTFDTSVVIAYRVRDLPAKFLLSAVVIAELTAGASDDSTRKDYEAMRRHYERLSAMITPASDDWLTASRILFWLSQAARKERAVKRRDWFPAQVSECF